MCPASLRTVRSAASFPSNCYRPVKKRNGPEKQQLLGNVHGKKWHLSLKLTKRANLLLIMKLFSVRDCKFRHNLELIVFIPDAVTNVALHPSQEGAEPAEDHFVTIAVMTVAGQTSNAIELSFEDGANSSAERQNREPTDSMTKVLPCEINTGTLMDPYIQTTTKNTFWKRCCNKTDQKKEQDDLEKPLGK